MARKILLADDSVTAQNMGRKILADAGYEVITVNNGSAALKKISELKPDVIVLDVYMPGYSGLEVCQKVKDTNDTARIPILLTVGKLEPFKPEEARRVRADGFIVKPFEASELLSALTKMEDKIVPRAESSKPGRFARTIAAVEEGRYDRTMASEEDSGWRDRIKFPSKKKEAEAEEVDDSTIYNPVNKDLRTVIERRTIEDRRQQENKPEEIKVDLGALAQGLPKDVTPEEIAALAAAAAQIKGSMGIGAENPGAGNSNEARTAEAHAAEPAVQPQVAAQVEAAAGSRADEVKTAEWKAEESKTDESKIDESKAAEVKSHEARAEEKIEAVASDPKPDTAQSKADEKVEPVADKPREVAAESVNSPSAADVAAAISALEPAAFSPSNSGSGNGLGSHDAANELVTMAVAAGAGSPKASRWTAVAAALLPEEAAISLESEMQKTYAVFAAAETASVPSTVAVAEPPAPVVSSAVEQLKVELSRSESPETAAATAPVSVSDSVGSPSVSPAVPDAPPSAASISAPSQGPEDAVPAEPPQSESAWSAGEKHAAAKSFEIASSHSQTAVPLASETAPAGSAEPAPAPTSEVSQSVEAKAQEIAAAPIAIVENLAAEDRSKEGLTKEDRAKEEKPQEVAAASAEPVQERATQAEPEQETKPREEFGQADLRSDDPRLDEDSKPDLRPEEPKMEGSTQQESAGKESKNEDSKSGESKSPDSLREERETLEAAARVFEEFRDKQAAAEKLTPAALIESLMEQPSASTSAGSVSQESPAALETSASESVSERTENTTHTEPAQKESARKEPAQKESEIAATTAAAWATWRRIRESGDPKSAPASASTQSSARNDEKKNGEQKHDEPADSAAMAVAAGAEKAPDDLLPAESESGDIANIVDSVLADLRPKIVAEISKKMGKKK